MPQPPPSQTRCRGVRAPSATGVRAGTATMGAKSRREVTTCTVQSMKSDHAAAFALSEEDKRRADAAMHGAKKTYAQGATVYMATQLSL